MLANKLPSLAPANRFYALNVRVLAMGQPSTPYTFMKVFEIWECIGAHKKWGHKEERDGDTQRERSHSTAFYTWNLYHYQQYIASVVQRIHAPATGNPTFLFLYCLGHRSRYEKKNCHLWEPDATMRSARSGNIYILLGSLPSVYYSSNAIWELTLREAFRR